MVKKIICGLVFLSTITLALPVYSAHDNARNEPTEKQEEGKETSQKTWWVLTVGAIGASLIGNELVPQYKEIQLGAAAVLGYCAKQFHDQKGNGGVFVAGAAAATNAIVFGLKRGFLTAVGAVD